MEETTKIFLEQGLLGAIIVILIGVVIFMQRKLDKKESDMSSLYDRWRVSESERADRLMQALDTASAVQSALVEKIETGRGKR